VRRGMIGPTARTGQAWGVRRRRAVAARRVRPLVVPEPRSNPTARGTLLARMGAGMPPRDRQACWLSRGRSTAAHRPTTPAAPHSGSMSTCNRAWSPVR